MSDNPESNDERPCLHCLIGDLIDEFYAQYGSLSGETDTIDVDEIITALAKTVASTNPARALWNASPTAPIASGPSAAAPQVKTHEFFIADGQIFIVDPKDHRVAEVIKLTAD